MSNVNLGGTFVDLAYEDYAEEVGGEKRTLALVRRTTCNVAEMHTLGLSKRSQLFNWHGTAEGSAVRAEPAKKSALRQGGLAFVQAYNPIKTLFAPVDRKAEALFSQPAFRSLGFTQSTLEQFQTMRHGSSRDPEGRRRALHALKAVQKRLCDTIDGVLADEEHGFTARKELRTTWEAFMNVEPPEGTMQLHEGHHWPFWVFLKEDVVDWIYWDTNRWLYAICAVLSPPPGNHSVSAL